MRVAAGVSLLLVLALSQACKEQPEEKSVAKAVQPARAVVPKVPAYRAGQVLLNGEKLELQKSPPVGIRPVAAGETRYKVRLTQWASTIFPGRKPLEAAIEQTFVLTVSVVPAAPGKIQAEFSLSEMEIGTLKPDGKRGDADFSRIQEFVKALESVKVYRTIDEATGRSGDFKIESKGTLMAGAKELFSQLTRDLVLEYPARPVASGASWKNGSTEDIDKDGSTKTLTLNWESVFQGTAGQGDTKVLVVKTVGSLEESGTVAKQGISGVVAGKGAFERLMLLDAGTMTPRKISLRSAMARSTVFARGAASLQHGEELYLLMDLELIEKGGAPK